MLFRTLACFRDNEDAVCGNEYEGASKFLPQGWLMVHNQTQGTAFAVSIAPRFGRASIRNLLGKARKIMTEVHNTTMK
jgi:hypothetical protein